MLYVLPQFQRQGIGSLLLKTALKWLGDKKNVYVNVVSYNKKGVSFYQKHGFKITRQLKGEILKTGKIMKEVEMVAKFS